MKWEPGALLGEFTTRSFGEYPSEENVSRLSQILEDCPHQKYSLSGRACKGILNRAKRRGKELPQELKAALIAQSVCKETESTDQIPQDATAQDGVGGGVTPLTQSTDPQLSVSKSEPVNLGGQRNPLAE